MRPDQDWRGVAALGLAVLAVCLLGVIVGLIILGKRDDAVQDSITGLATIGAGLTGGFAGWFAHDRADAVIRRHEQAQPPPVDEAQ